MNTIRVRHDLPAHEKALLAALGWDYVIDADAEPCVRFGGKNEERLRPGGCPECAEVEAA